MGAPGRIAEYLSSDSRGRGEAEADPSVFALGRPAESAMRPRDRLRLEAGVGREFDEQRFVGDQIVEHRTQERRVRGCGSEVVGDPVRLCRGIGSAASAIGGDEGERAHRQRSSGIGVCGLHRFQGIAHSPILLS